MKKIIVCIFLTTLFLNTNNSYSRDYNLNRVGIAPVQSTASGQSFGRGSTREGAYADALRRIPAGAIQTGTFFNGSSSSRADGKEYTGSYSCRITWKKY